MNNRLFNPFDRIAGTKSLVIGLVAMILTIVAAKINGVYFPDTISIQASEGITLKSLAIQIPANWLIFSTILYIAALLFSKSHVRAIDIYGTQAVARIPHLGAALICFSDATIEMGKFVINKYLEQGDALVMISPGKMALAIFQVVVITLIAIWVIVLSVNAYKVSANIKGGKLAAIYIVSLIISMGISEYLSFRLNNFNLI